MFDLFQHSIFVPSSSITALDDTNTIVRLGGDKGGKTMKTAIFDYYKSELSWLCELQQDLEPSMLVLFKQSDQGVQRLHSKPFTT